MATADTVDMGPPHAPKEDAIEAFQTIEHELKRKLVHLRHEANSTSFLTGSVSVVIMVP